MTTQQFEGKAKAQLFGLVRDKDGRPVIDDPETLPQPIRDMLTAAEYREIYGKDR